ncbi:putative pre-16S rRNA nuclease [Capsulimonas corticalis]|uniref:Putative pre-16S rRNA nuclease n=1 Tax=Capsulimonas corticalis TaxID=2219043 RepID=A0A402CPP3_9BACT|nr:Holliday junction resolvase RuvX [Capsulimonas corticalis]BDI32980.1 putative pre-16S rRNA nuclease [Capsulimonas corticalis]
MRFVALDVGEVRIGVAVCDQLEIAAFPVCTLRRVGNLKRDVAALAAIIAEQEADAVVSGLPLSLDGEVGPQAQRVQGFVQALERACGLKTVYWDESMTSVDAHEVLIAQGVSRARRRELVDQMAAVLILDSYLEHRRRTSAPRDAIV